MAKITVAQDKASAKAKRGPGMGQLLAQPNAQAAREHAKAVLAAALEGKPEPEAQQEQEQEASAAAVAFVRAARPAAGDLADVSGWKVLLGQGLVTEKQAKWMISIAHRPSVTDAMRESLKVRLEQGFNRQAASQFITTYKDIPTAAADAAREEAINPGPGTTPAKVPAAPVADVPAGRYAVVDPTDGVLKFYRFDRPTEGRWAGYTFLKVQASDDLHPIRNRGHKEAILAEIAKDVLGAERRYGQELGKCSRCGRTLTDETSRAYGIGPDCRSKR